MPVSYSGTAITWPDSSTTTSGWTGFKNRIINGAMMIDQRNAGASVTPTNGQYLNDRWQAALTQSSKFTVQQSSTAPTGFVNSLLITSSSAYSVTATDQFYIEQPIEGLNCSDLSWGSASAQTVTLSFWVRSSLTGTFSGHISNSGYSRNYPFTYTISAANTWEQKSVTVSGDQSGTWLTTNGTGIRVGFNLGFGSNFNGTANTWTGSTFLSVSGATSVVGTNGATFYITGVQLERGSTASSFEYLDIGRQLIMCQRYCQVFRSLGGEYDYFAGAAFYNSTSGRAWKPLLTTMRASPTVSTSGTFYIDSVSYVSLNSINLESAEPESIRLGYTASSAGSNATGYGAFLAGSPASTQVLTVSAEL